MAKRLARLKYQLHQEPGPAGGVLPDSAHFDGPVHLDLLIAHTPFERQALEKRRVFANGNEALAAVRPEDLVVYKLIPFRGRDQGDIADVIEKVIESGEDFDWSAVERYAKDFGVGDRVERVRSVERKHRRGQRLRRCSLSLCVVDGPEGEGFSLGVGLIVVAEKPLLERELLPVKRQPKRDTLERGESLILTLALPVHWSAGVRDALEVRDGFLVSHTTTIRRLKWVRRSVLWLPR